MLSLELGIPLSEMLRRMTLKDYITYLRYYADISDEKEDEDVVSTPEQMMAGFYAEP